MTTLMVACVPLCNGDMMSDLEFASIPKVKAVTQDSSSSRKCYRTRLNTDTGEDVRGILIAPRALDVFGAEVHIRCVVVGKASFSVIDAARYKFLIDADVFHHSSNLSITIPFPPIIIGTGITKTPQTMNANLFTELYVKNAGTFSQCESLLDLSCSLKLDTRKAAKNLTAKPTLTQLCGTIKSVSANGIKPVELNILASYPDFVPRKLMSLLPQYSDSSSSNSNLQVHSAQSGEINASTQRSESTSTTTRPRLDSNYINPTSCGESYNVTSRVSSINHGIQNPSIFTEPNLSRKELSSSGVNRKYRPYTVPGTGESIRSSGGRNQSVSSTNETQIHKEYSQKSNLQSSSIDHPSMGASSDYPGDVLNAGFRDPTSQRSIHQNSNRRNNSPQAHRTFLPSSNAHSFVEINSNASSASVSKLSQSEDTNTSAKTNSNIARTSYSNNSLSSNAGPLASTTFPELQTDNPLDYFTKSPSVYTLTGLDNCQRPKLSEPLPSNSPPSNHSSISQLPYHARSSFTTTHPTFLPSVDQVRVPSSNIVNTLPENSGSLQSFQFSNADSSSYTSADRNQVLPSNMVNTPTSNLESLQSVQFAANTSHASYTRQPNLPATLPEYYGFPSTAGNTMFDSTVFDNGVMDTLQQTSWTLEDDLFPDVYQNSSDIDENDPTWQALRRDLF